MCGTGGLVVLDFDNLDLYERWSHVHQYHYANTYRVSTSRPGMHCYFWCDELPEHSTKLPDADVKATGYVLAPPSGGYQIESESEIMRIATVEVLLPGLLSGLAVLAERAENEESELVTSVGQSNGSTNPQSLSSPFSALSASGVTHVRLVPGIAYRIKQRLSILDLCNLYTKMESGTNGYLWGRCPAPDHEDKTPSFSCDLKTGRAHCWSGNCTLHTGDGLDVIDLVCKLEGLQDTDAMRMLGLHLGILKGVSG